VRLGLVDPSESGLIKVEGGIWVGFAGRPELESKRSK